MDPRGDENERIRQLTELNRQQADQLRFETAPWGGDTTYPVTSAGGVNNWIHFAAVQDGLQAGGNLVASRLLHPAANPKPDEGEHQGAQQRHHPQFLRERPRRATRRNGPERLFQCCHRTCECFLS